MRLGFGQIEAALSEMHFVESSRSSAFRARLRYLQQRVNLGIPRGGTGRRPNFAVGHAFLFGLALELEQYGMTPETIAEMIEGNLTELREAVRTVASRHGSASEAVIIWFIPDALGSSIADGRSIAAATFAWCNASGLAEQIAPWLLPAGPVARLAIVNLSALAGQIIDGLASGAEQAPFFAELAAWADEREAA